MKASLLSWMLLLAPALGAQDNNVLGEYGPLVRRELMDGRPRLTVIAEDNPAKELIRMIARRYELEIVGLDLLGNSLVSAHIEDRDLKSTLTAILGSLDLRHERHGKLLEIKPIEDLSSEQLFAMADAAWAEFHSRFPSHPMAPHAQFSRAEIKERTGNLSAARDLYLKLVKDYPDSLEMGPALLRAGQLSAKQGDTSQAAEILRRLSSMDISDSLQASTRMELARVLISQGDPQQALNLIKSMEVDYPAADQGEATVRRLIRARALNKLGKFAVALREIDMLDRNFDDLSAWESLFIRATAFEGMGLHADAAISWLAYAVKAIGKDRANAYASAARLALLANDEMAVIFISDKAIEDGFEAQVSEYLMQAKERLGLAEPQQDNDLAAKLEEGEKRIEAGEILRAMELLQSLFQNRTRIHELDVKARLDVAWARCIEDQEGLAQAIQILANERKTFSSSDELKLLDIAAASLFEKHELFVEATQAYQGEYGQ